MDASSLPAIRTVLNVNNGAEQPCVRFANS